MLAHANSTVFSGFSHQIEKDLIEAVSVVIISDIQEEVNAAPFVAVEVESTNITNKAKTSSLLCYVSNKGEVKEAFLGFDNVIKDRRAAVIEDYVHSVLEKFSCVDK